MEAFDGGRDYQPSSVETKYDELEAELRKLTEKSQESLLKLIEESTVEADLRRLSKEAEGSLSKLLESLDYEAMEADLLRLADESSRDWLDFLKKENGKYE